MVVLFVLVTFGLAFLGLAALVAAGTVVVVARTRSGQSLTAALAGSAPTGKRALRAH